MLVKSSQSCGSGKENKMDTHWQTINEYLREEDVEGLIAIGAPADEYESEAKDIARALDAFQPAEQTGANIAAALALIWARYFNLSADDMALRLPSLQRVAGKILAG
jgi:hypothetical protein